MPPSLALFFWFLLLVALLRFDSATDRRGSAALWVPLTWLFLLGSRLPSQWLGGLSGGGAAENLEEGNPFDRAIWLVLIVTGIAILGKRRSFRLKDYIRRNLPLTIFVIFGVLSVAWSEYAAVAFKRWFRDVGNYLMIFVVMSDAQPQQATCTVLRRLGYLLLPLSVILIKYFPDVARQYDYWTGSVSYCGVTTSKNMLGAACLVCGLFFFWDTVARWANRKEVQTRKTILINLAMIGMALWLLQMCNSATSRLCLLLGCGIVLIAQTRLIQRHSMVLKAGIPILLISFTVLALGFDLNARIAESVGRDPTLTDRTKIWALVLTLEESPILGSGYESFWLGPKLYRIWQEFGHINEAHNGFLEIYLNLGVVGLALLITVLAFGYRMICSALSHPGRFAVYAIALWTVLLFYAISEAAFRSGLIWLSFLLSLMNVTISRDDRLQHARLVSRSESLNFTSVFPNKT